MTLSIWCRHRSHDWQVSVVDARRKGTIDELFFRHTRWKLLCTQLLITVYTFWIQKLTIQQHTRVIVK